MDVFLRKRASSFSLLFPIFSYFSNKSVMTLTLLPYNFNSVSEL